MTNQQRTQRITAYSCLATSLLSLVAVLVIPGCGQSPNSLQSLLGKAVQHQQDGEYESAINALTVCLKKYPNCTEARYLRGTCHAATNNLEAARTDLSAVTVAKPNWDRGWWALGTVYRASGNKTLSLEAFQKSLALNDQAADVNFELGRLLEEGGDREQALVHFSTSRCDEPGPLRRSIPIRMPSGIVFSRSRDRCSERSGSDRTKEWKCVATTRPGVRTSRTKQSGTRRPERRLSPAA